VTVPTPGVGVALMSSNISSCRFVWRIERAVDNVWLQLAVMLLDSDALSFKLGAITAGVQTGNPST